MREPAPLLIHPRQPGRPPPPDQRCHRNAGDDLRTQLQELIDTGTGDLNNFGARVAAIISRWQRDAVQQTRDALQTLTPPAINVAPTQAITGREAATAGSEHAFSLLYGRGQDQTYYHASWSNARNAPTKPSAVNNALNRAPVIRRADF